MNAIDFPLIFLVAVVMGTLAQLTSSYSKGGWLSNLGIGFLGAFAGVAAARKLDAPEIYNLAIGVVSFPIIYSVIGAVIFLAAAGLFVRPGRR
ncbi:MAG TPA: hypothetical protein VLL97_00445 [Acidobacteriota bacterium]|nr:hypothetical protein [Acidobacteriota bacterium]